MGAIGELGARIVSRDVMRHARVRESELARMERRERIELDRRAERYRRERPRIRLDGRIVVVVDDGIATGGTARVACQVARSRGASRVVMAVPGRAAGVDDRTGGGGRRVRLRGHA
jgi:putative phosphoribosyl transferase